MKINEVEIEELACIACGKTEDQASTLIDSEEVEDLVFETFGVDLQTFAEIVEALLPLTPVVVTAITGSRVNAFVTGQRCIVKREAK